MKKICTEDPQKLSLEADPLSKRGVRLFNSSTYSPKRGSASRTHQHTAPGMGSTSRIHQHTDSKRGSVSRIHQHTAPQKGVHLKNSSSYRRGPPLEYQQPKGVHLQISSTKRGSASRFHQPKRGPINQKGGPPLGTIFQDLAKFLSNLDLC